MTLIKFIRKYAPDFCYMTAQEYMEWLEQDKLFEDSDKLFSISARLSMWTQQGYFLRVKLPNSCAYKYIFNKEYRL